MINKVIFFLDLLKGTLPIYHSLLSINIKFVLHKRINSN
nr:hypothetical protein B11C_110097 [Bartonella sp. 1-1C]